MTETIQVFYSPQITFAGVVTYHETLLYTNSSGQQFIASAGPVVDPRLTLGLSDVQAAAQPLTSSTSDWGKLQAAAGPIANFTSAQITSWLGLNQSNPNDTVISSSSSLQSQWNAITAAAANITAGNFQYSPLTLNSNSAVATELSAAGLSQPASSGTLQSHFSPAGDHILAVPGAKPFNPFATSVVADSGGNQQVVVTDSSSGATYRIADSASTTYEQIQETTGGKSTLWISGNGGNISINNSAVNVASGSSNNFTGTGDTFTDGGSDILGVAGGSNVINGKASDTIYVSGTTSSTADTVTANSATVNTAQSSYVSITGGSNTLNDAGSSVFNAYGTGTNADTFNLNLNNVAGLGGTVFLGSGVQANLTGGGSDITGAGDNKVGISFSKDSSDTVNFNGSYLTNTLNVGANTQANVNSSAGSNINLTSGDSVGAYGGGNLINASANNLVVIGNTNGNEDIVAATGLQSGGTTANGQPTGVSLNGSAQVEVQGNNNDVFGNAQSTEDLEGTGDRALLTGGAVNLTTNGTSAQVVGNENTVGIQTVPSQGGTDTASIAGNNNIVAGSHGVVNLQQSDTTTVINGDYLTIHDTPNDIVKVTGTSDSNYGTSSDVVDFYGSTDGDSSSGTPTPVDEGDTDPPGSLDGYGYGYGYDFIKGKPPQSTTNIASIAGFDKSVSAVAAATTSTADGETINNARSKALQSATDSANGTSTLGDTLEGLRWNTSVVTWSFGSTAFNAQEQSTIESAFSAWSTVSGVKFEQVAEGQSSDIALNFNNLDTANSGVIGFTSYHNTNGIFEAGTTIDLEDPTDTALTNGQNGQLTYSGTGVTLYQVALHEIGHALGLNDTSDANSVMYYGSSSSNQQLDATDIANAQLLYGAPMGTTASTATTSTSATSGKDASATTAASAARGSANTQAAALHTASDGSVNQLIQSIAAFKGSSSAASSPSLLSPDEHTVHLASIYRLSA